MNPPDAPLRVAVALETVPSFFGIADKAAPSSGREYSGLAVQVFENIADKLGMARQLVPVYGTKSEICERVASREFDAAIGDFSITADRLLNFSMTFPFQRANLVVITRFSSSSSQSVFFKPFTARLWWLILGFVAAIILLLLWLEQHHIFAKKRIRPGQTLPDKNPSHPSPNPEPTTPDSDPSRQETTQGPELVAEGPELKNEPGQEVVPESRWSNLELIALGFGRALWWVLHSILFAHDKQDVRSFLGRVVAGVWLLGVVIMFTAYQANLTALLSTKMTRPVCRSVDEALNKPEWTIGIQNTSWFYERRSEFGMRSTSFTVARNISDWNTKLQSGGKKGGVDAILTEYPYAALFVKKFGCKNYAIVGGEAQDGRFAWGGWSFVFNRTHSGHRDRFDREILRMQLDGVMDAYERTWLGLDFCEPAPPKNQIGFRDVQNLLICVGATFVAVALASLARCWLDRRPIERETPAGAS